MCSLSSIKKRSMGIRCSLCNGSEVSEKLRNHLYEYLECSECGLVFVNPSQLLPPKLEKKHYESHENSPDDVNYRNFLNQIFEPLNKKLAGNSFGLDYGSGPGPTLHVMFQEAGHKMNIYDPFFAPHSSVLNLKYDFITVTETAEHFYRPAEEFKKLWGMLKPGGYLGIMTLLIPDDEPFEDWYYIREATHVAFYSKKTFWWLAKKLCAKLIMINNRSLILSNI